MNEVRLQRGAGVLDPWDRAGAGTYQRRGRYSRIPAQRCGCRPRSSTSTSILVRTVRRAVSRVAWTCRSRRICSMPVYDYLCPGCGPFTMLRPMAEFDAPYPVRSAARRRLGASGGAGDVGGWSGSAAPPLRPDERSADAPVRTRAILQGAAAARHASRGKYAWRNQSATRSAPSGCSPRSVTRSAAVI